MEENSIDASPRLHILFEDLADSRYNPLSKDQELPLILLVQASGSIDPVPLEVVEAQRRLVESNLRFTVTIAKSISRRNNTITLEDAIAEGTRGIYKAITKFDTTRNYKLFSYAVYWIREYIAALCRSEIKYRRHISGQALLLDDPSKEVTSAIAEDGHYDKIIEQDFIKALLKEQRRILSGTEILIISLYYKIRSPFTSPLTLSDIGKLLHITPSRVGQLKDRALTKLKATLSNDSF